jgi:hypothetical protein
MVTIAKPHTHSVVEEPKEPKELCSAMFRMRLRGTKERNGTFF